MTLSALGNVVKRASDDGADRGHSRLVHVNVAPVIVVVVVGPMAARKECHDANVVVVFRDSALSISRSGSPMNSDVGGGRMAAVCSSEPIDIRIRCIHDDVSDVLIVLLSVDPID